MKKTVLFIGGLLLAMQINPALAIDASSGYSNRSAVFTYAQRCELLNRSQLQAVKSGQLQARGALLRSGMTLRKVNSLRDNADDSVRDVDCANEEALVEIERVKKAHNTWLNMHRLPYSAKYREWITSRDTTLEERRWRVVQNIVLEEDTVVRFGSTTLQGRHSLDLVIENNSTPKAVLLRMRDPSKLESPPNQFMRKLLKLPLDGVAGLSPPDSATNTHFASLRVTAEPGLVSKEQNTQGVRFGFDEATLQAFSVLDPREAVSIDIYWSNGFGRKDRHKRLFVEVGDFLAARMFAEAKD
ncbi:MAG: hypothetical protein L3J04_08770 [Robiginitomaculum sp.]|nr:hypothetical protein [Robiginitomaculum sp.]